MATILSQSCTDLAALRAFRNLDREVGVTIRKLSRARSSNIGRAIRVAGLHRQKSKAIRKLAQVIAGRYNGQIQQALTGPFEEVRQRLQELPNVGPKTADVLLLTLGQPTISIDTHVNRVSKRLGLAPEKANYEKTRSVLMMLFNESQYHVIPLLFMSHGRQTCKARDPLCPACPIMKLCPYPKKSSGREKLGRSGPAKRA